jgi:long-chain acyl-CoA synthetase
MNRPNLISLFDSFRGLGVGPAVVQTRGYRRQSRTYAELSAHALFWSDALGARGIGSGDRVLIWGANSFEWVACFWAIQLQGAVAVPMDAGATPEFVRRTVEQSGAKLILRDRHLPELSCDCPALILTDLQDVSASPRLAGDAVPNPGDHTTRTSIAEILFTSGTTAEPRGVVLSHGNFLANLEPIERGMQRYLKYERFLHPLRFVSLVPMSHVFGQFMALFVPPLLGATVVFENSANPAEILRTIKRERATVVIAVPRMLELLRSAMERGIDAHGWRQWFDTNFAGAEKQPFLRRAWRFRRIHRLLGFRFWAFISGGAALSSETELFFKRLGYAVVQGYGMTETASLISLNHPFSAAEGSVGKILPGREFKLAEDGEILVRGENVSSGYWEKGSLQESANENDGWLRTGDLGELDANGNLKFRGRKKNVIVTPAGLNIYPEDLEGALKKQPVIRDAVVIPLERDGNAEPCAVLLLKREVKGGNKVEEVKDEDAASAIAGANATLAEYQRMGAWLVWPEPDFPRTPTGKPRLAEIAARAAELLNTAPSHVPDASSFASSSKTVERYLGSKSLASLSSLDRVELLSALEHRYNAEINEAAFSGAKSVAELERLIEQPAAPANGLLRESDYHYPRWTQREPVRLFRLLVYYLLVWPATQILGHPCIVGREHLANLKGPAIIVSNHITRRADIGLILAALPVRFRHRVATAMGGESLRRMRVPPRKWFFARRWAYQLGHILVTALFNVFPLPQSSGFRQSFRFAGESADRGYSVLIFPEGEVNNSDDGRMAPFQAGIGMLAENLALPIIPMRLDGVWQMKKEHRRLADFGEITVHIGAPITFRSGTPADEIARRLESLVSAL